MLFTPKFSKFQKLQKNKVKRFSNKNLCLAFGTFGLKSTCSGVLTAKQIEMLSNYLSKNIKKLGQYWIRVFAHFPVTAKPLEVRMGKGKGYVDTWVCKISAGSILCEISGLSDKNSLELLKKISLKLPIRTILVQRHVT